MNTNTSAAPKLLVMLVGLALTCGASVCEAYTASVIATVNMRAGPSTEYPPVALLDTGTFVEVYGCEDGYNWCDVQVGANRGWVDAAYLVAQSPSGPVVIADAGLLLALPIIAFSFGAYWDTWYRARPWYGRRPYYFDYWNRYPHGQPPPPPMYRPPGWRPPPPRPRPHGGRPPGGGGGSRPPSPGGGGGGRPPGAGEGKPPGGGAAGGKPLPRPRPSTRPAPQPQPQPR